MRVPLHQRLLSAGRAVLGTTREGIANPAWEEAKGRVLIVRLSPLRDVDRSSAHLILFAETRAALPRAYIDFAFMPDRQDRELLDRAGLPWFPGATEGRSPADFDLILVSNAFGLELVNLPRLLSTAGLPLRASTRAALPSAPLLILGGSNAGQAGALLDFEGESGARGDSLVDGLFLGEGEGAIGPLAALLLDASRGRAERLEAAAGIEGFWPALHPGLRTRRRILPAVPPPLLSWPLLDTPEAGTARLQITAGCPGYCSFCFEGWDRRPYRERPLDEVLAAARGLRARSGAETLEVYSFNFNTHEEIFRIIYELGRIFRTVNFMSQRLDVLADTPGLMAAELAADKRSFTLGIEGISARMRAYYRKGLDEEALDRLLSLVVAPGVRELKLFYIIAGFEDEGDLAEFAAFAAALAERREARAKGLRVLVSSGYLVRLPGTPLGRAPLVLDEGILGPISAALGAACEAQGLEWRLAVHFDEYCADQVLSLAGGSLLPWLEGLAGAGLHEVYEGSLARGIWPSLEAFASSRGLLSPDFLGEKGRSPALPFLEEGPSGAALDAEYEKASAFIDRTTCLGGRCADCGACEEPSSRVFLTRHRTAPATRADIERITRLQAAKRSFALFFVAVERPDTLAGASVAAQEAWLLSRLVALEGEAYRKVFSARLAFPQPGGDFGLVEGAAGRAVFALEGPDPAALGQLARAGGFAVLEGGPAPRSLDLEARLPPDFPTLAAFAREGGRVPTAESLLADWLRLSRLAFTERRSEGGGRVYEIAARDLGKKVAFMARTEGAAIFLKLGGRASIVELLAPLGPALAATIGVRVLGWSD